MSGWGGIPPSICSQVQKCLNLIKEGVGGQHFPNHTETSKNLNYPDGGGRGQVYLWIWRLPLAQPSPCFSPIICFVALALFIDEPFSFFLLNTFQIFLQCGDGMEFIEASLILQAFLDTLPWNLEHIERLLVVEQLYKHSCLFVKINKEDGW